MDNFYLSPGRLVQGDLFKPQTTDHKGRPATTASGQPKTTYFAALAFPKNDPVFAQFYEALKQEATAAFPGGEYNGAKFAWKIKDGDNPQWSSKPGFAGNWVLSISSSFPATVYKEVAGQAPQAITEPEQAKRGHWYRPCVSTRPNRDTNDGGLYINHDFFVWVAYGEEIHGGPDVAAVLAAAAPTQLPPGASATPVSSGPQPAVPGAMPTPGPQPAVPGAMPTPGPQPAVPGGSPLPPPNPAILAPPVPAAPVHEMTAAAQGVPYEKWVESGWNDDQLRAQGYMK